MCVATVCNSYLQASDGFSRIYPIPSLLRPSLQVIFTSAIKHWHTLMSNSTKVVDDAFSEKIVSDVKIAVHISVIAEPETIGQKQWGNHCDRVTMTPQARWPTISTSVSGIPPDVWDRFYAAADRKGVTGREAMEEAILDLSSDLDVGATIVWPQPTQGKRRSIEVHDSIRSTLRTIMTTTLLRQNVIVLAAMQRWLAKKR